MKAHGPKSMVSPEIAMLSVFITPWMNPTCIQLATSLAWRATDGAQGARGRDARRLELRVVAVDHVIGEAFDRLGVVPARRNTERCPLCTWLAATRVKIAPGSRCSRKTTSPVATAASARVVAIPSACMASLTRYSRSTGPSAARPSPLREKGVRPEPLSWISRRSPKRSIHLAQQDRAPVAELRNELAELMPCVGHGDRVGARAGSGCRKKPPPASAHPDPRIRDRALWPAPD